ncbi:MAG: hypothetical protein N2037_14945, partial [Acidimicrobiales bacterium]|nr:hypothetical protein [Acidimicrobiales bacterium]
MAVFSAFDPPPRWKSQERVWEFANGSLLWLGFLQYEADAYQYLSQEFDAICVDEASQLIPEGLALLETRLRTTKSGVVPQLVLASNPGGPGHRSLLERFPVVPKPGDEPLVFEGVEVGATRELRIET